MEVTPKGQETLDLDKQKGYEDKHRKQAMEQWHPLPMKVVTPQINENKWEIP